MNIHLTEDMKSLASDLIYPATRAHRQNCEQCGDYTPVTWYEQCKECYGRSLHQMEEWNTTSGLFHEMPYFVGLARNPLFSSHDIMNMKKHYAIAFINYQQNLMDYITIYHR